MSQSSSSEPVKAWLCNDYAALVGALIVHAPTRTRARIAYAKETGQDDFLRVRALRCPELDGQLDAWPSDDWWRVKGYNSDPWTY